MLKKHNKTQHFLTNSEFPCQFQVHHFGGSASMARTPTADKSPIQDFLQLKTFVPCGRNAMFRRKVVSLSHKTATFGSGFSDHGPGGQKKTLKTQGFSMFFLAVDFVCDQPGPLHAEKIQKSLLFLVNRQVFIRKSEKLNTFHYFLEPCLQCKMALISYQAAWKTILKHKFQMPHLGKCSLKLGLGFAMIVPKLTKIDKKIPFRRYGQKLVFLTFRRYGQIGGTRTFDHTYGGYGQLPSKRYGQLGRGSATHYQTLKIARPYIYTWPCDIFALRREWLRRVWKVVWPHLPKTV